MIVLNSVQILAAVARALETHVLPELQDQFAAVQVHAAIKALAEVGDRLQNGDPCDGMNQRIEDGARGVAESIRAESPAYAEEIEAVLAARPESDEPRDRARQLGQDLWTLVSQRDDPGAARLLEVLQQNVLQTAGEDAIWICGESIHSLM
jgi:hypothetical protein